jgi:hypothetical protein
VKGEYQPTGLQRKGTSQELAPEQPERITTDRPGYKQLSNEASEKLKLNVGPTTLKEIAGLAGIEWEPKILTGKQASGRALERLNVCDRAISVLEDILSNTNRTVGELSREVSSRLTEMSRDIHEIRRAVNHLYTQLQATPPEGYVVPQQAMNQARKTILVQPNNGR